MAKDFRQDKPPEPYQEPRKAQEAPKAAGEPPEPHQEPRKAQEAPKAAGILVPPAEQWEHLGDQLIAMAMGIAAGSVKYQKVHDELIRLGTQAKEQAKKLR